MTGERITVEETPLQRLEREIRHTLGIGSNAKTPVHAEILAVAVAIDTKDAIIGDLADEVLASCVHRRADGPCWCSVKRAGGGHWLGCEQKRELLRRAGRIK